MGVRVGAAARGTVLRPASSDADASELSAFMNHCELATGEGFADLAALHEFSVRDLRGFWRLFLEWSRIARDGSPEPVCTDDRCEHAEFFPELRLSYVENLLAASSPADLDRPALVACHADRPPERLTRGDLRERVRRVAAGLAEIGVAPGDRVAAVAANNAEVAIAALASAALGATFSTAPLDMGVPALLSRFEQLAPKVLFANLAGRAEVTAATLPTRVADVAQALPSLRAVVALDDGAPPPGLELPFHRLAELTATPPVGRDTWARFPFNHPLFVLFTSGTTGRPKCLEHGAGGTLLEHVKEHRLHVDLGPDDTLFFHTSAAWMMWNWQLSALASGCTIVVYDGPLTGPETLWRIVSDERVTVFGTSPPYLQLCEDRGFSPRRELDLDLSRLRSVLSTGSVLHDWQFDWAREHVGEVPLQSISGGTDIVGCFVLGGPNLPVRRGMIQCRSLGMDVQAMPTAAQPPDSPAGDLVCRNPFPSRPLRLIGDDGTRFHAAYFAQNPGVWTHGDLIEFDDQGQARIHGRSDGVVHVNGVRIGPAEIYRALHRVPEVRAAMAIEQEQSDLRGQSRLVLLVVVREPAQLEGRLAMRIRREIAHYASPLHVPELVVAVPELPETHSGKRSERAARDVVNGAPVANIEALANPASLDAIRRAVDEAAERASELARGAETLGTGSTRSQLIAIWESVLGIAPLRASDDFFDAGGTSLAALRLLELIHERMGVELPLSVLVYARTPAAMAALIEDPTVDLAPPLVLLRPGEGRPLFVVHPLWGDVLTLRPLALALDTRRPVYGLQSRGLNPGREPHTRVEEMAVSYLEQIRTVQPSGPYALAGYSFGGLVAFEMARMLSARGEPVEWLGLIDPAVYHVWLPRLHRWRYLAERPLGRIRSLIAARSRWARYRSDGTPLWVPVRLRRPTTPLLQRLDRVNRAAFHAYRPGHYDGDATFFAGERAIGESVCDPLPVWREAIAGTLTVTAAPGRHDELVSAERVQVIADEIARRLDDAEPAPGTLAEPEPSAV